MDIFGFVSVVIVGDESRTDIWQMSQYCCVTIYPSINLSITCLCTTVGIDPASIPILAIPAILKYLWNSNGSLESSNHRVISSAQLLFQKMKQILHMSTVFVRLPLHPSPIYLSGNSELEWCHASRIKAIMIVNGAAWFVLLHWL